MEARIKRNPNAFRTKFDLNSADGSHRRCFCKKSKCIKKYCECFSAGMKCNDRCRCEDCANAKTVRARIPGASASFLLTNMNRTC